MINAACVWDGKLGLVIDRVDGRLFAWWFIGRRAGFMKVGVC